MLHLSPTPVTLWIGIVALLVVAVLCVLSWKRSPHRGRTALLEILRFLAAAAVVLLLWQPEWRHILHPDTKPKIAILWDASKSMSTVDAQLPAEPENTLRERMRVTREKYCWSCHEKMDPLGLPFEMYNHAGLYRTTELDQPVDTSGEITESGDPALDGPVQDAFEMIEKLAASERVEQVFVRHAFRFWMGRNETLHDSPVLQAAHRAYRDSGGSMKALITSLVTSDAFLYRTVEDRTGVRE